MVESVRKTQSEKMDKMLHNMSLVISKMDDLNLRFSALENHPPSPPPSPSPFSSPVTHRHFLKLDVPRFDGSDPHGWIFKISQFFDYHSTPEEEWITVASFYLDALETRFAPTAFDDSRGKLFKLTQTSSVAVYLTSGLARLHEERFHDLTRLVRPRSGPKPLSLLTWSPTTPLVPSFPLKQLPPLLLASPLRTRFKQLIEPEMADRRERGLCFNCDQKFSRNHRCPARYMLLVAEEEDESSESSLHASIMEPNPPDPVSPVITDDPNQAQLIFVDGGSTHNFIQEAMANFLGLSRSPISVLKVIVGSGEVLPCTEGHNFKVELYIFGMIGSDIVLGAQWLKQLSPILMDYQNLTKQFNHPNGLIVLKGQTTSPPEPISFHQLKCVIHSDPTMQIFSFRKIEIEAQVSKLLANGWIQPSVSPFSSPVLLLKKKDGSWRMCVDYRALNAITIRDRFPLPTVDELLDELGHARCFSKLDLTYRFHQIHISAVIDWPVPTSVKGLHGFLGLTGFYQKFVKVLLQNGHHIAYFSMIFCSRMARASAYLRELHAITSAVKRWRQCLLGHFFVIQTDQKSMKELMSQKEVQGDSSYIALLEKYDTNPSSHNEEESGFFHILVIRQQYSETFMTLIQGDMLVSQRPCNVLVPIFIGTQ
ncbi:hypothetical protein V8G54_008438 [Vigna mungo]|uniref:RNA-directed DNA polymerase n=1 Tax=Vigna mungo TaxID=3915 RepID=A0AAQ3P372_VIGMU